MPYVSKAAKDSLNPHLEPLLLRLLTPGDLAYCLFRMLDQVAEVRPQLPRSFDKIAEASGAATEALAEWRFRRVRPYEHKKWEENGDVEEA